MIFNQLFFYSLAQTFYESDPIFIKKTITDSTNRKNIAHFCICEWFISYD